MSNRARRLWWTAVLAGCLMTLTSGCYIRRGFAVHWNWTLHAHRYRCHGPACCTDEPPAVVGDADDCVDCPGHGGHHGIRHGRAAEGPPPVAEELSPDPEPAGPTYFHPVPTRPVFGPRSEQPDSIEDQTLLPLPAPSQSAEPMMPLLPPPEVDDSQDKEEDSSTSEQPADASPSSDSSTKLRRLPKGRETKLTGWRAVSTPTARKRTIRSTVAARADDSVQAKASGAKKKRPCPHCSVTFKPRRAAADD